MCALDIERTLEMQPLRRSNGQFLKGMRRTSWEDLALNHNTSEVKVSLSAGAF